MELSHVVITSVDRDDLENGGAEAFAACIREIRARLPEASVEVLIPDFKGSEQALGIVLEAQPDILNHNLETCERLYRLARPGGRYNRALQLLANARHLTPDALTKSGIILGMGEEWDEVITCMRDLRRSDVNILTLGQYLRPTDAHLPVARYYTPAEFDELAEVGRSLGFTHVQASPLTRSSYHAWEQAEAAVGRMGGYEDGRLGGSRISARESGPGATITLPALEFPASVVLTNEAMPEPPSRRAD
jgi:lipoic acid synthetase